MAVGKTKDAFANIAFLTVAESAANTLTFAQLQLTTTLMSEKAALIIHRAEFNLNNINSCFDSTSDYCDLALTVSDRVTPLYDLSQPEILFFARTQRQDFGAAASGFLYDGPRIIDFTNLPGTGLIVPADRLYIGIKSTGAPGANVQSVQMRLYYTVKSIATDEYWELIEARRVMTT